VRLWGVRARLGAPYIGIIIVRIMTFYYLLQKGCVFSQENQKWSSTKPYFKKLCNYLKLNTDTKRLRMNKIIFLYICANEIN